ncbi:uncharacterized conserved protein [Longilinea arvoryzae]|uniref:Uncharacterized conserved protein n=2 Tax=Longilinea arvoryzae TaxID=360412 RepID=A0A0K8MYC8_9CHLR|nr:uncharacterized conserved protein [Longilinea arvoryzae]
MFTFRFRIGSGLRRWWIGLTRFEFADHQARIRLRQRLPLAAGLLALIWHLVLPSEQAVLLVTAWLGLMLSSYLWARQMARRVSGSRRLLSSALQVGDELEEQVSLRNTSGLPVLAAEFIDRSDLPGHSVAGVRAVEGDGHADWKAAVVCTRRGLFTLGPWELHLSDPFGIFTVEQVYPQRSEVLVYPPLAPLPPALLPRGRTRGDQRPLRRMLGADTVAAASARAYLPGDPLRFIHWPTTARKGALYTRIFDPEAISAVWLIADLHSGASDSATMETMAVLLASLADQLLRGRLAVGLLALGLRPQVLPPRNGLTALGPLLRALAQIEADAPQPLEDTLLRAGEMISQRSLYLLITPDISPRWMPALQGLARRPGGQSGQVVLLDATPSDVKSAAPALADLLRRQGFPADVVRREDVRPISGAYGALRRWEYITLGTGRAVVRQRPRDVAGMPR